MLLPNITPLFLPALLLYLVLTITTAQCPNGPTYMFVTTQPKNTTGGAPLAVQPAVTLYGIEGTPCYGDNSTIVFASLQQNPAVFATLRMENGSLPTSQSEITSGTGPRATTLNGTCTFEGLYINENATDYTLLFVATEHGLFAESKPFSVTVGVPHYMKLHRDHTSGVLWAHMATGTRGGKFTVSGTGGLPINPPPRLSLVDKGGNVVIDPQYSRGVSASVSLTRWPTAQKYLNYSDTVWTFSTIHHNNDSNHSTNTQYRQCIQHCPNVRHIVFVVLANRLVVLHFQVHVF